MSETNGDRSLGKWLKEHFIGPVLIAILTAGILMYAELAKLNTKMDVYTQSQLDHEVRIRSLEKSKP